MIKKPRIIMPLAFTLCFLYHPEVYGASSIKEGGKAGLKKAQSASASDAHAPFSVFVNSFDKKTVFSLLKSDVQEKSDKKVTKNKKFKEPKTASNAQSHKGQKLSQGIELASLVASKSKAEVRFKDDRSDSEARLAPVPSANDFPAAGLRLAKEETLPSKGVEAEGLTVPPRKDPTLSPEGLAWRQTIVEGSPIEQGPSSETHSASKIGEESSEPALVPEIIRSSTLAEGDGFPSAPIEEIKKASEAIQVDSSATGIKNQTLPQDGAPSLDSESLSEGGQTEGASNQSPPSDQGSSITISNSPGPKQRGIKVGVETPSVHPITIAPGSRKYGGDDVEIRISPIFNVLVQMPEAVEHFNPSNDLLEVTQIPSNPNILKLKLRPTGSIVPMSLHVIDVLGNIYTFTIVGGPANLIVEYPKTIMVNKKNNKTPPLGSQNPSSILAGLDVYDAIQLVVGDVPKKDDYEIELISARYVHHGGFLQYVLRIARKDRQDFDLVSDDPEDPFKGVKFTIWANDERLDGGSSYRRSRDVEWTRIDLLSERDSRRKGYPVMRVAVQVRASILEVEDWESSFITVSDKNGFTKFNLPILLRDDRTPRTPSPEAGRGQQIESDGLGGSIKGDSYKIEGISDFRDNE